jgi:glutamate/tyrosine decarboxylase-like PLP-dependent enzyme
MNRPESFQKIINGNYYKIGRFGKVFYWGSDGWNLSSLSRKEYDRMTGQLNEVKLKISAGTDKNREVKTITNSNCSTVTIKTNITKKHRKYQLNIGGQYFGSYEDEAAAMKERQRIRLERGMIFIPESG